MKKRIISIIISLVIVAGLLPTVTPPATAAVWNGTTTAVTETSEDGSAGTGYYLVDTAEKLAWVASVTNPGSYTFSGKTVKLTVDIVLNTGDASTWGSSPPANTWTPIGTQANMFGGTFDGSGHTISGVYVATGYPVGLFGATSGPSIKNVGVVNSYIRGSGATNTRVGGIVGYVINGPLIQNCYFSGTVIAITTSSQSHQAIAGGIAGDGYAHIQNCYNTANISATSANGAAYAGGIMGEKSNSGSVKNCYNTGTLNATGIYDTCIGGILGFNYSGSLDGNSGYWLSSAAVNAVGLNSGGGTPVMESFNTSGTLSNAVNGSTSLLVVLNNWVNTQADTAFYTWKAGSPYPVLDVPYVPPTYTATVAVNKDGSAWGAGAPIITFGATSGTAVANGASVGNGTYNIYADGTDTGVDISVSSGAANATLDYYTLTLSAGAGTNSPTGGGIYLAGKSVPISATLDAGYIWSKWTSSNTGLLSDQSTRSTSITMPAGAVALTSTSALIIYTINYTFNGGAATNPPSYQTTDTFTLNNATRAGYSFVGWSGTGLTGNANTTVTIAAGSTGNRSYTASWKANTPAAPLSSIVTAKSDTSFTITTQAGYEYSVNGTSWYSGAGSYTFTGLIAGTAYNLVCRVAAVNTGNISAASDASAALSDTTKNAAPAVPTLAFDSITANSVTITAVTGTEYSKDNGVNWQDGNSFSGLTPATQYTFAIRIKETADTVAGIKASVAQYTPAATPAAGVGYSIDYATEKITVNGGYEVNTDAGFGAGTTIVNNASVNPNTTYYIRVAASGGVAASTHVSFTLPARPAAPSTMTVSKTSGSITISTTAGQEYKINSGAWQDSGSFTGLTPNTGYTVYTRVKATGTTFASADYSISVTTKSVGSVTVPTPSAITYDPGKTLADITLPLGWAWSASATVPTVAMSSYSAVYTPTDTATVDYSGEAGYANTSGTVTITRTIALTVNRATPTAADFTYTAPASLDYDATTKSAAVLVNGSISGMGTVTVKYYQGGTEIAAPTNVGTYTVKIDIAQGGNYAAATAVTDSAWTFTIVKVAQASLSITNKPAGVVTYGDTFTLSAPGGSGTGDLTWESSNVNSATVDANGAVIIIGVGETTITAKKAADGNYLADVTAAYTFTPAKRLITVNAPSATGGWTKIYDGGTAFDTAAITVGSITNKVGADVVHVSVQSATYDTSAISGDKTLTITYAIDGTNSGNYAVPNNTAINTASITAATPTITLTAKTAVYTDKKIEIAAATVTGVTGGTTPDGAVTYTYYTKDTCTTADKTTVDKSGAQAVGDAPKNAGTYYVKATIAASGNYSAATSAAVMLTIYYPSSGEDKSSTPVIVDGKTIDMGTSEVKDNTTTVVVDQTKMTEQLSSAMDSVIIPITSKTDTASAQLVVQNVERMAERGVSLTIISGDVSYSIPAGAIDTPAALKALGASDSSKVPFNITISKLSNSSVTIQNGTLMVPPVAFTVTATYDGKSVEVEKFGSYVQRVIEIPDGINPESITTAVVMEADGTQRHVPTAVYSENGKWYARINAMTNSTYALIQNSASFTDTKGKWYDASVTEMASREIINGIGENMFAGERAITRAEFAAILIRALGLPAKSTAAQAFNDVRANKWYYGAVGTAYEYGLVTGKGNGLFDPTGNITRQEAMAMIARAAKLAGYVGKADNISGFSDVDKIGAWAFDAVRLNVGSGLIVGNNGQLRPTDNISRAETAVVILRLLQTAKLVDVRS